MKVQVRRLPHHAGLALPARQTAGSAGYDVCSAEADFTIAAGERRLVRSGLAFAIPPGYEAQVRPRSGLALQHGLTLPNSPATIDSDYRGELQIPMINLGREPVVVTRGMRIAQLVFQRVEAVELVEVEELPLSDRGTGGFGSTGALIACLLAGVATAAAAQAAGSGPFSRADSLRGSFTSSGRAWWDVTFYDLHVTIHPADSSVAGFNAITYRVLPGGSARDMQVDLMAPLEIDSVVQARRALKVRREGNAWFVRLAARQRPGDVNTVTVYYHGKPQPAKRPPWDGGITWTTDSLGRPWIVTTDQGMGASVWWPNKDTQADEPDSQRVALTVPDPMIDVANGRLHGTTHHEDGTTTFEWFVVNPINNYAIAIAAGSYDHFSDSFPGERGTLALDFWPLTYHREAAEQQFPQAKSMLQCFEHWFGPFPWYEDGFKLVEVPHPGMEHQSAVAYGNWYANGYRGRDASGTGLGLKWDFIIVHESAHEWFGNNITTKDLADMWVHESFANYAEGLYTECLFGKEAGAQYVIGTRRGIRNDRPIIPAYGVNAEGSGDMYPKGGNMLHTIRQIVGDDEKWRTILRGVNATFWHRTVMGKEIEDYISRQSGVDLTKVFDQYLRTARVPVLEYTIAGTTLSYRWADVVPGFDMQLGITVAPDTFTAVHPTEAWQTLPLRLTDPAEFRADSNYYVITRKGGAQ